MLKERIPEYRQCGDWNFSDWIITANKFTFNGNQISFICYRCFRRTWVARLKASYGLTRNYPIGIDPEVTIGRLMDVEIILQLPEMEWVDITKPVNSEMLKSMLYASITQKDIDVLGALETILEMNRIKVKGFSTYQFNNGIKHLHEIVNQLKLKEVEILRSETK